MSEQELARSYQDEKNSLSPAFENENDIRNLGIFYSEEEKNEQSLWDTNLADVEKFLMEHKYEIENSFNILDWLKIYSEAILE